MPYVVNGIGTWYYGQRRVHRAAGTCESCSAFGELTSYDTTLYGVVFFVPLLPLGAKRILNECPACRRHRSLPLREWERIKESDSREVIEDLGRNPGDAAAVVRAIDLACAFQDEELFNHVVAAVAGHRTDDAVIQARLGDGYNYFARRREAEAAFRASLAVRDDPEVRCTLAVTLLKQHRPDEAAQFLTDAESRPDGIGLLGLLAVGYQAAGRHDDALAVLDRRDAAFPEFAATKEADHERKHAAKYRGTSKIVRSPLLDDSDKAGYRAGSRFSGVYRWVGPAIAAGLLAWYLGAAWHAGRHRAVYLVNGWDKHYRVAVNGTAHELRPGQVRKIYLAEGELTVAAADATLIEPYSGRLTSNFWSRPFAQPLALINPDRLALLERQVAVYSKNPDSRNDPDVPLAPGPVHELTGIDLPFQPFPAQLKVEGSSARRVRVGLAETPTSTSRLLWMQRTFGPAAAVEYARACFRFDPTDPVMVTAAVSTMPRDRVTAELRPRLAARPLLIEVRRAYQFLTDRGEPATDLVAEYRQLAGELNESAESLYLLARVSDPADAAEILRRAADKQPTSPYVFHSLGYAALAAGDAAAAVKWSRKAVELAPNSPLFRGTTRRALCAAGNFAEAAAALAGEQPETTEFERIVELSRCHAAAGNDEAARQAAAQFLQSATGAAPDVLTKVRASLESARCQGRRDAAGYLSAADAGGLEPSLDRLLLTDQLDKAVTQFEAEDGPRGSDEAGLIYLAARKLKRDDVAEKAVKSLTELLADGDRIDRELGRMVSGRVPIDPARVRMLHGNPEQKRIVAAVLADRCPDHAEALRSLARQLNFSRDAAGLVLVHVMP